MIRIIPLAEADMLAIEQLLDAAFGSDRHGRTAYRLREGVTAIPGKSFAAFDGAALVGTLQSWPVELAGADGQAVPLVLVGPVAVDPGRQRDGIGKALMAQALAAIDAAGADAVLIGDPEYYDRFFGFTAEHTGGWGVPGPVERHRLLARLRSGRAIPVEGALRARREMAVR